MPKTLNENLLLPNIDSQAFKRVFNRPVNSI